LAITVKINDAPSDVEFMSIGSNICDGGILHDESDDMKQAANKNIKNAVQ
jgi:hypothetical protein